MYESHYNLTKNPFAMVPDPGAMYLTPSHREALAGLLYAILCRKGFVAMIGEPGTGKTTLLRKALQQIPSGVAHTSFLVNPTLTASEFLELILLKMGVQYVPDSKAARLFLLERMLMDANQANKFPILVIDEAHKLHPSVFEEVRLLTNFETTEKKLLQIVIAGQPELYAVLDRADLRQLKQRIAVRLTIDPLSANEVREYIAYRWTNAGGQSRAPFSDEAMALIARSSAGIPRLVNSICDSALLLAFASQANSVLGSHVVEVLADLCLSEAAGAAAWTEAPAAPDPIPSTAELIEPTIQPVSARVATDYMDSDSETLLRSYMPGPQRPWLLQRWMTRKRS